MAVLHQKHRGKRKARLWMPFILSLLMVMVNGCDNGNDPVSDGGSGVVPATTGASATDLAGYLTMGINDEYRARDTYVAIMNKFGQVRPFVNIKKAEEQHIGMLVNLFNNYGLAVPADTVGGLPVPATFSASCSLGVQAEIDNGNLYNTLLAGTADYPDVQAVFRSLQSVSLNQHLPAFQRCAD